MTSIADRAVRLAISARGTKRAMRTRESYLAYVRGLTIRPTAFGPPRRLNRKVDMAVDFIDGWPVYRLTPKAHTQAIRNGVLYFHGGAFVADIEPQEWSLAAQVAVEANAVVTVPIYPLAPRATAAQVIPTATAIAQTLIETYGAAHSTLMGDSCGGGMALTVAQQLRDRGIDAPAHTVLISPWLDITCSDPAMKDIAPKDPWLAPAGFVTAGELWRGDLDPLDPTVSPLHGDLTGLGPILLFCGTDDILNADAKNLMIRAAEAGLPVDFHEGHSMIHVYPLLPTPEGRRARRTIVEALRD